MRKGVVWQNHHITYKPEVTVRIRRMVHFYITKLNRFTGFTANEKKALRAVLRQKPTLRRRDL